MECKVSLSLIPQTETEIDSNVTFFKQASERALVFGGYSRAANPGKEAYFARKKSVCNMDLDDETTWKCSIFSSSCQG